MTKTNGDRTDKNIYKSHKHAERNKKERKNRNRG